jgi:hypothetical protein
VDHRQTLFFDLNKKATCNPLQQPGLGMTGAALLQGLGAHQAERCCTFVLSWPRSMKASIS